MYFKFCKRYLCKIEPIIKTLLNEFFQGTSVLFLTRENKQKKALSFVFPSFDEKGGWEGGFYHPLPPPPSPLFKPFFLGGGLTTTMKCHTNISQKK